MSFVSLPMGLFLPPGEAKVDRFLGLADGEGRLAFETKRPEEQALGVAHRKSVGVHVLSLEDDLLELLGPAAVSTEPRVRERASVDGSPISATALALHAPRPSSRTSQSLDVSAVEVKA